jgi:hypothetical protein
MTTDEILMEILAELRKMNQKLDVANMNLDAIASR